MAKNYTPKPVEPVIENEEILEEDLVVDESEVVLDEAVAVVETISAPTKADTYLAVDGDSYASIAAKFNKGSFTNFQYAKLLLDLNGGKSITAGTEVRLG